MSRSRRSGALCTTESAEVRSGQLTGRRRGCCVSRSLDQSPRRTAGHVKSRRRSTRPPPSSPSSESPYLPCEAVIWPFFGPRGRPITANTTQSSQGASQSQRAQKPSANASPASVTSRWIARCAGGEGDVPPPFSGGLWIPADRQSEPYRGLR